MNSKIKKQLSLIYNYYNDFYTRRSPNPHPEIAAKYAMEDIYNKYKHLSDKVIIILLNQELEDRGIEQ